MLMQKIKKSTIILVIGIIIFSLGAYQNIRYEDAKDSGYSVEATVTRVKVHEHDDGDTYTLWGEYEKDGKTYSNVKLGLFTEYRKVGEIVKLVVNPDAPTKKMAEGGLFGVIGLVITVAALIRKHKEKKAEKLSGAPVTNTPENDIQSE